MRGGIRGLPPKPPCTSHRKQSAGAALPPSRSRTRRRSGDNSTSTHPQTQSTSTNNSPLCHHIPTDSHCLPLSPQPAKRRQSNNNRELFAALDRCESILSSQRFVAGPTLTEADVRLFMTLIRFDPVYVVYFKVGTLGWELHTRKFDLVPVTLSALQRLLSTSLLFPSPTQPLAARQPPFINRPTIIHQTSSPLRPTGSSSGSTPT